MGRKRAPSFFSVLKVTIQNTSLLLPSTTPAVKSSFMLNRKIRERIKYELNDYGREFTVLSLIQVVNPETKRAAVGFGSHSISAHGHIYPQSQEKGNNPWRIIEVCRAWIVPLLMWAKSSCHLCP